MPIVIHFSPTISLFVSAQSALCMVSHVKQEETSHIDDILSLEMPIGDYAEICPIEFQRKNNNFTVRSLSFLERYLYLGIDSKERSIIKLQDKRDDFQISL